MMNLPLLPATVIGSWSFPGWYAKFCDDVARTPERFGADDREEALRDAVRLAVDDQLRAGADLVTDGEMQRVDFNLGFYDYLSGMVPLPPARPRPARPLPLYLPAGRPERAGPRRRVPTPAHCHRRPGQGACPGAVY